MESKLDASEDIRYTVITIVMKLFSSCRLYAACFSVLGAVCIRAFLFADDSLIDPYRRKERCSFQDILHTGGFSG